MESDSAPKLSVLIITYNHEAFISQAIESALAQKASFPIEIVIGEDCSPDGTRDIVLDYQRRFPQTIHVLAHEKNVGMIRNFEETLMACRGSYVAMLEGDDYWTNPEKLEKQVAFLDSHPEFAVCFHDVDVIFSDGSPTRRFCPPGQKEVSTLTDLLYSDFIPTCSTVFRRGLFGRLPPWIHELKMCDWLLHILNARHGQIKFMNEVMGVYRIHEGGAWSRLTAIESVQARMAFCSRLNELLGPEYSEAITETTARIEGELPSAYRQCSLIAASKARYDDALRYYGKALRLSPGMLIKTQFYRDILHLCADAIRRRKPAQE